MNLSHEQETILQSLTIEQRLAYDSLDARAKGIFLNGSDHERNMTTLDMQTRKPISNIRLHSVGDEVDVMKYDGIFAWVRTERGHRGFLRLVPS